MPPRRRSRALAPVRHIDFYRVSIKESSAPSDVTQHASVAALFDPTLKSWARVDSVFNNVRMGLGALVGGRRDRGLEVHRRNQLNGNVCSIFIREAFRMMKSQGGLIINSGSISAYAPRPNSIA